MLRRNSWHWTLVCDFLIMSIMFCVAFILSREFVSYRVSLIKVPESDEKEVIYLKNYEIKFSTSLNISTTSFSRNTDCSNSKDN